jgi:hypothetical protein
VVATNSIFRGIAAFLAVEVTVPLQVRPITYRYTTFLILGCRITLAMVGKPWQCKHGFDVFHAGWLYTIWAALMLFSGLVTILVAWKGEAWRRKAEVQEAIAPGT